MAGTTVYDDSMNLSSHSDPNCECDDGAAEIADTTVYDGSMNLTFHSDPNCECDDGAAEIADTTVYDRSMSLISQSNTNLRDDDTRVDNAIGIVDETVMSPSERVISILNHDEYENNIGEDNVYDVQRVFLHFSKNGKRYFRVQWEGYPREFNQWVEEDDFLPGNVILEEYKRSHNLL